MLTKQFMVAMHMIYDSFRERYIEDNPGCNENDVERAFLNRSLSLVWNVRDPTPTKVTELIDSIR